MKAILTIVLLHAVLFLFSQKRVIDNESYKSFPSVRNPTISNDGNYVIYTVDFPGDERKMILQAVDNSWKKMLPQVGYGLFSADSKFLFFTSKDSLGIFKLKDKNLTMLPGVSSFKTATQGNGRWLAFESRLTLKGVVLKDLSKEKEVQFPNATDYKFSNTGNILLIKSTVAGEIGLSVLLWLDLETGHVDTVMSTHDKISNFSFDDSETRLAFIGVSKGGRNQLYSYRKGTGSPVITVDSCIPGLRDLVISNEGYMQSEFPKFSKGGSLFFLARKAKDAEAKDSNGSKSELAKVDVWHYKDEYLQSEQLLNLRDEKEENYLVAFHEGDQRAIQISADSDNNPLRYFEDFRNDSFLVVFSKSNYVNELNPSLQIKQSVFLVSLRDGSRKRIIDQIRYPSFVKVSIKKQYIIWYDEQSKGYFTYQLRTGATRNITSHIPFPLFNDENDRPVPAFPFGIAGCQEDDSAMFLYDRYDLWRVDPQGLKKPVNITKQYGRIHRTVLRYVDFAYANEINCSVMSFNQDLILAGFNRSTKANGFFKLNMLTGTGVEKLLMSQHIYYMPNSVGISLANSPLSPQKSKDNHVYILGKMGIADYPNLYATKDFRKLDQLSDFEPQKNFNWITAELVHWSRFDKTKGEGILYMPENFNKHKKYPVIFYYYEKFADGINRYIPAELSDGTLNVPSFVSNDYLVFVPDITYRTGHPGQSAYNTVASAAKFLSTLPYVDGSKIGLLGHSFGGYETNYIVTKTNQFSAAVSSAGICDLPSQYGSLYPSFGRSDQLRVEITSWRMGQSLWDNPKLYIENSPVFAANKITTPILIMHNKTDTNVPFAQGVEFFTALRRLGKKSWLLQYDGERHSLNYESNQLDFSIRIKQFFDHYLKGAPAPKWMVQGVPARLKNIDNGLELVSPN